MTASEIGEFHAAAIGRAELNRDQRTDDVGNPRLDGGSVGKLSETQVSGLTAAQIAAFTPDQISALTQNENDQTESLSVADIRPGRATDVGSLTLQQLAD